MNSNQIASELSYLVMLRRQAEQNGQKDAPKVKAPVQKAATFDAYAETARPSGPVVWL